MEGADFTLAHLEGDGRLSLAGLALGHLAGGPALAQATFECNLPAPTFGANSDVSLPTGCARESR
jgi:hypothetical protein